jgi:anaerobic dimethyl sulfoxide reductase subunit A
MPSIPVFCGKDCGGDACPLLAVVDDGHVARVVNNPAGGKYLKGCRRGFNLPLEHYAPDRILTPLVRTGPRGSGQFRPVSWDEALSATAERLDEIRARHGASAVMNCSSAGSLGALHSTPTLSNRFLNLFGGCTRLTGSWSNGAARFVLPYLLGEEWSVAGFDAATMQYAKMIILWGANVLETRMGCEVPQRVMEARRRGAEIVVIDPRRSATVQHAATWWIQCRPGTDVALMLAVLYVLITEERIDRPFITSHSVGFDQLERYVVGADGGVPHTPAWAADICGVPAPEITRFARAYAATRPAMLLPGYSIQRVFAGEESFRLSVALQVATGNFGQRGGSTGAINSTLPVPRVGRLEVPARTEQPSVPVVRWAEAILQGRDDGYPSDIHAVYLMGSNVLNQSNDVRRGAAALEKVDFVVCHEMFLTPTARYSDVILPVASALEKEDVGIPWLGNYLLYKPQVVPPRGQARNDYDILCDLADRLGFERAFSGGRSAAEWIHHFISESEVADPDEFRRTGIYLAPDQERVGLADFAADPRRHPLSTDSGKVEIASERYEREHGFPAIPTWQPPPEDSRFPLRLITPKSPYRTHSQGSNLPAIRRLAAHALTMHPDDAASRGLVDGDLVRVYNAHGETHIPILLSEEVLPGVACLLEGIWAELDGSGVDHAGSANMLTGTHGTTPAIACIMHAVAVEVERSAQA